MSWYARADEDLASLATSVVASAEDSGYVAANLISEDPANPAKLTTTSGDWVLAFAAPVSPVAAALIYQYLDADLDVRMQGNDSDSWGSPAFDQAFTIPAKRKDGPSYQRWTINPICLFEYEGDTPPTYAYWRLVIVGTNSQNVIVGRLWLPSALHRVTLFHDGDIGEYDDTAEIANKTALGSDLIYVPGGPQRGLSAALIGTDLNAGSAPVQEASDFRALAQSANGRSTPFLFVPFETNDAWQVRFKSPKRDRSHRQDGSQAWPCEVEEVSRGLPWP